MRRLAEMKTGSLSIALIVMVAVVIGLGLALVVTDPSRPTSYAGSPPSGAVALAPASQECNGFNDETCPQKSAQYESCGIRDGEEADDGFFCLDIEPCSQGSFCDPTKLEGQDNECGGRFGLDDPGAGECIGEGNEGSCQCPCQEGADCFFASNDCDGQPELCRPTNVFNAPGPEGFAVNSPEGACDCNNDGCTEGASCSVALASTADVCGPNGFCDLSDGEGGEGTCVCGTQPCEFIDAEGFEETVDPCPETVKCESGTNCKKHSDCGGVGVGRCVDGNCECECISGISCTGEGGDCGSYGEGASFGECNPHGEDGQLKCQCTDDIGCSPNDCVPNETLCNGKSEDCGGNGEACDIFDDNMGVCRSCGFDCEFFCDEGECLGIESEIENGLTQDDCDELAEQLGSDEGCTLDDGENTCNCDGIPTDLCFTCYDLGESDVCGLD